MLSDDLQIPNDENIRMLHLLFYRSQRWNILVNENYQVLYLSSHCSMLNYYVIYQHNNFMTKKNTTVENIFSLWLDL